MSGNNKKMKSGSTSSDAEDIISTLPDDLIHRILSFVEAAEAVQTSALSKRWKYVWTTLPDVNFDRHGKPISRRRDIRVVEKFLSLRNFFSDLSTARLCISVKPPQVLCENFVHYAISHRVKDLTLELDPDHQPFKLATFNSDKLKKLCLCVNVEELSSESDVWDLPALTTLYYESPDYTSFRLWDSCFTCLPNLKSLGIDYFDLLDTPFSFQLPGLIILRLSFCELPRTIWGFPSLESLELFDVIFPDNMSEIFSALINLRTLSISLHSITLQRDHFISCPKLENLSISTFHCERYGFVVFAPNLSNFSSSGIFSIAFGASQLNKVDVEFSSWTRGDKEVGYPRLMSMLLALGTTRNLTFDSQGIEALCKISSLFVDLSSPFSNLRYVKLPRGYDEESSIPSALRSYLLGGSPKATIVTEWPEDYIIQQPATVSLTAENGALEEPLAAPTKGLVDCQNINKSVSVETVDMGIEEQHVGIIPLTEADRVRQNDFRAEGTSTEGVSSSERDYVLWQGSEVNCQYACLLDRIMQKYPETFEHFTMKNKKLSTVRLNMLCSSLNDFTKIPMAEVDSEIIVQYRDIFAYLQSLGFNLSWVLSRLENIQNIRFSSPLIAELHATDCGIDEAKSEVQDLQSRLGDAVDRLQSLQTLRAENMTESEKRFGSMGTKLAVGSIGDDLLSDP